MKDSEERMKTFGNSQNHQTSPSQTPCSRIASHAQAELPSASSAARSSWVESGLRDARAIASSSLPLLQREWGDFLRYRDWDWFVTLTFPDRVHPEQGNRRWRAWIHSLEQSEFRTLHGQLLIWIRATEIQSRGVLHYHALLANVPGIPPFVAMRLWEQISSGFARVLPYDRRRGACYYIAKCANEIDVSEAWFGESRRVEKRR
jgi:hypothetical protein